MKMNVEKKNAEKIHMCKIEILFTILIVIMPILHSYAASSFVSFGELTIILLIPIMILDMMKNRKKIRLNVFWIFIMYTILISLMIVFTHPDFSSEVIKRVVRDVFYFVVIFVFSNVYFNKEYGLIFYKRVGLIAAYFLIFQAISFKIFNITIPWVIGKIPLFYTISDKVAYMNMYNSMYLYNFRPTSFFLEPSVFPLYIAPLLVVLLFGSNMQKNYKNIVIISIALVLSTSATAYAILLVIVIVWLSIYRNSKNIKIFTVIVICFLIVFFMLNNTESVMRVLRRVTELGNAESNSTNIRVLRGFYYFMALDPIYKIFGIGFGSITDFSNSYSLSGMYGVGLNYEYMSSLTYILVSSGIVGFTIFFLFFAASFLKKSKLKKTLIIVVFLMMLSSSVYSSPNFVLIMAYINSDIKTNNN